VVSEGSVIVAIPPSFQTLPAEQMALVIRRPRTGDAFPAIFASTLHAHRSNMSIELVASCKKHATDGTVVSVLLFDGRRFRAPSFGLGARHGEGGGRRGDAGGVVGTVIDGEELRRRREIITLRSGAAEIGIGFSRVCAAGAIRCDTLLAAVVKDQVWTHDNVVHTGG